MITLTRLELILIAAIILIGIAWLYTYRQTEQAFIDNSQVHLDRIDSLQMVIITRDSVDYQDSIARIKKRTVTQNKQHETKKADILRLAPDDLDSSYRSALRDRQ